MCHNRPCLFCRAIEAAQNGRFAQAIILFDDLLESNPQHHRARMRRAKLYTLTGKPHRALREFQFLCGEQECCEEAMLNMASVHAILGDYEASEHARNRKPSPSDQPRPLRLPRADTFRN